MSYTKRSPKNVAVTLLALLLSAIMLGQTQITPKSKRFTIPFEMNQGRIYFDAFVNQRGSYRFLFDAVTPGYTREEVTFSSGGLQLEGTLFLPASAKPVPSVVLLHGSGETKRDDNFYYAELFAKQGIAALTYDKRGVGQSQGNPQAWRYFSFEALAANAAAGVCRSDEEISAQRPPDSHPE